MSRSPRTFTAQPQAVGAPSEEVASSLALPCRGIDAERLVLGRREWVALPDLGIGPLNAKTDSGARSSSLHAEEVELSDDRSCVSFVTHNHYGNLIACQATVAGVVRVRSSTGVAHRRIFIETTAVFAGGFRYPIRLSLANRSDMRCPMLIGRRALSGFFLIDPQVSHLLGGVRDLERSVPGFRFQ